MSNPNTKPLKDKREDYAKILSPEETQQIWDFLESKFGIDKNLYQESFGFAQNRRGRLWIASKLALEFISKERMNPAKVLTCAIGKSDSQKLLQDNEMQIRLTLDGAMYFNSQISKNILYLTEEEEVTWYTGEVIDRSSDPNLANDVYILAKERTKEVIGSTICKNGFLLNFVPKWRRPNRTDGNDTIFTESENSG